MLKNIMDKILQNEFESKLSQKLKKKVSINGFKYTSGGCINQGGKLTTNQGDFFVKWNFANLYPGMFEAEAKGLTILNKTNAIKIPEVVADGSINNTAYIVLEFISQGDTQNNFWENFGTSLSRLHQQTNIKYGLDHDNFVGSLLQSNKCYSNWIDFFICERLQKQIKLAFDYGKMPGSIINKFDNLFTMIPDILIMEKPSLLHGDLWSGNYMVAADGYPCLIDPAIYYGNREAEIAYTKLFGGFPDKFYIAYNKCYPLSIKGLGKRLDIYNLYPLLVHHNLFGGIYLNAVETILNRFGL